MLRNALLAFALLLCATADAQQPVRFGFLRRQLAGRGPQARHTVTRTPADRTTAHSPVARHAGKQGSTGLPAGFVKVKARHRWLVLLRGRLSVTLIDTVPRSIKDGRFVLGDACKEFYFAGWNMCVAAWCADGLMLTMQRTLRDEFITGGRSWSLAPMRRALRFGIRPRKVRSTSAP